MRRGYWVFSNY